MAPTNTPTHTANPTMATTQQSHITLSEPYLLEATEPLRASIQDTNCTPYLTSYIFPEKENIPADVVRLQQFLNTYE